MFGSEYAIMPNGVAIRLSFKAFDCWSTVKSFACLPKPACTLAVMNDAHIVTNT